VDVDHWHEVLEEACSALCNLAAGSREVTTAAALVQAGAHMALVEAAREAIRAHLPATLELTTFALRNLARGGDATKAELVRGDIHESLVVSMVWTAAGEETEGAARSALVELAGPDTTWVDRGPEPLERLMYRLRVTRMAFEMPDWVASTATRVAPLLAAGLPLPFVGDVCLLAFGAELEPREGWKRDLPHGQRLLESGVAELRDRARAP
jgi:hypothetical protein